MDIKEYLSSIGKRGGQARARKLSASERKRISIMGSNKRWNKNISLPAKQELCIWKDRFNFPCKKEAIKDQYCKQHHPSYKY